MDKAQIIKALESIKEEKKRNFLQSYDLIITLKDIDIKTKPVDAFVVMPHSRGKKIKVCGLVGQELADKAQKICDFVIREKDFPMYKEDKKKVKKLAQDYDFFIAQANLMAQIAAVFGRGFGPRGKMPNPKAGAVIPANADVDVLIKRLQNTVAVKAKTMAAIQCTIGSEDMNFEPVAENILAVYNQLLKLLPSEEQNIRTVYVKKSMSAVVKV